MPPDHLLGVQDDDQATIKEHHEGPLVVHVQEFTCALWWNLFINSSDDTALLGDD
jgi:hypothetical protein